ncbi:Hypothetical predicted protein [Marmota monax]|uniref:Major facilitator superfamily (MFS) profile domain-containing protein n=1 Tax=Marmota monax TaxID=9995 RepID=A0A5E4A1G6_MARMO|nr:Hypothetical predicted protein [Marmota monax]
MAFTDLLDTLGGVGRFQLIYTALLLLPCGLLACHNFLQNFTAAAVPHHCQLPANHTEATTNDSGAWLRATIPLDQHGVPEPCQRFTEPQWALLSPNTSVYGVATEDCKDGWVYDRSVFPSTIVMEWDLVCEARTLRDLAQSIYMAGVLLGAAVFGSLADRMELRPLHMLGEPHPQPAPPTRANAGTLHTGSSPPLCLHFEGFSIFLWKSCAVLCNVHTASCVQMSQNSPPWKDYETEQGPGFEEVQLLHLLFPPLPLFPPFRLVGRPSQTPELIPSTPHHTWSLYM